VDLLILLLVVAYPTIYLLLFADPGAGETHQL
jgi:hypothetical protein